LLHPNNKKLSKLQEAKTARDFGGVITPGSGNQWHSKGDVRTPDFLVECKLTSKDSYSLKASTWSKIATEALLEGRDPVMEINFIDRGVSVVVMDKNDFLARIAPELQGDIGT